MIDMIEVCIGDGYDSNLQKIIMKIIQENNGTCKITLQDLDFTMADVEIYGDKVQLDFDTWLGASIKGKKEIVERFKKEIDKTREQQN